MSLKKVHCPKSVPAVRGSSKAVVVAAIPDLASRKVAPQVDKSTGVFGCVARLDRQPLLIAGGVDEAGDAYFATASLMLNRDNLEQVLAAQFAAKEGGSAEVACGTRTLVIAQPDRAVRCKATADDGTKYAAAVLLDASASITSVDFTEA